MADDVYVKDAQSGAAVPVSSDDVGGVQFQRIKLDIGGDGVSSPVVAGNPLPVTGTITAVTAITNALPAGDNNIGNVDVITMPVTHVIADGGTISTITNVVHVDDNAGSLTVDGAVTATLAAETTKVIGTVNISASQTVGLAAGTAEIGKLAAGTALIGKVGIDQATANANEVVIKSGTITAVTSITNAVAVTNAGITTIAGAVAGTEMQVDVVAALPAGTNAIGKLAANSGVDIGDVDVLSIAAGTNNIGSFLPYTQPANFVSGTTAAITDTTRTALIAAQGDGIKSYLTHILVTNSHATVGTFVKIEDNTTTRYQGFAAALGGGFSITLPIPLVGTANTAWNVSCVTTGASVIANASGYKGA